ncbi:MAG TPA: hypothetical protein VKK79_05315 [Candidatus Lokiarchaeia archaeon]|nr:hypothetical protein [Candidatus Lokiarchaeia archaeon]
MFFIDWLHLDWFRISAAAFGILAGVYVAVKLKNHYYRWSSHPPNLVSPSPIQVSITREKLGRQIMLSWEGAANNLRSVAFWVNGHTPRFLANIAWGLSLHAKSVRITEIAQVKEGELPIEEMLDTDQIFYAGICSLAPTRLKNESIRSVTLIQPSLLPKVPLQMPVENFYAIFSNRTHTRIMEAARVAGFSVISFPGGKKSKGHEVALFGAILKVIDAERRIPE